VNGVLQYTLNVNWGMIELVTIHGKRLVYLLL